MKAVILVAGFGSRLRPYTDTLPKSLLPIGKTTTLARMIKSLQAHAINEFVFITGHFEPMIVAYITENFPHIKATFVRNNLYKKTNTGYSLLLAEPYVRGSSFVKLDGDVNFDPKILDKLLSTADDASYICLDKTAVDDEVIKAQLDSNNAIVALGKYVVTALAAGESIGIEKINAACSHALFDALSSIMKDLKNWQEYYEYAYDYLIKNTNHIFKHVDISGLRWVEMDTIEDYTVARAHFSIPTSPLLNRPIKNSPGKARQNKFLMLQ